MDPPLIAAEDDIPMKRLIHFWLIFLFLPVPAFADDWQSLSSGFFYKKQEVSKATLHIFKIDLRQYRVAPLLNPSSVQSVKSLAEKSKAILVINANFFDASKKILGLVQDKDKILNPLKKISWWSVLAIGKQSIHIVHSNDWDGKRHVTAAFEAGPRLVVDGHVPKLKSESSPKTAVGVDAQGYFYIIVSQNPLNIQNLATFLATAEKSGGLGLKNALNFDGGSSTQIYVRIGDFELDLPSFVWVPAALGVFSK